MKLKAITILTIAVALFISACGKSDADMTKAVNDKLATEKFVGVTAVVNDGVATVTGEVDDAAAKGRVDATVMKVEGIKSVKNDLTTRPLPTPAPPSPDKMLVGTIDQALNQKGITGVTVSAADGVVTLSGTVDKTKLAEVMAVANEAKPKKVINNLNK